jgi:hypothetical protein
MTVNIRGSLAPGEIRTISPAPIDLSTLSASPSYVYPLKIELRSDLTPVATIRTPVVFLNLPPGRNRADTPLTLAWTFVLDGPVLRRADGTFDEAAVRALLEPGGTLRGEVDALSTLVGTRSRVPVDVSVSPLLLAQLEQLASGYRATSGGSTQTVPAGVDDAAVARDVLDRLRQVLRSRSVEVSALPYAGPNIPALLSAGLDGDLGSQIAVGRSVVERIGGVTPAPNVIRPVGSLLDQQSLVQLSRDGFDLFVLDAPSVLRQPQEKEFAQPATAALQVGPEPGQTVTAAVPDPGFQSLLASGFLASDPHLAAQALLGELAQIWLERPGVARSVAVAFTEETPVSGKLFEPFVQEAAAAPWLRPRSLTSMARRFPPSGQPATLVPQVGEAFPTWYVGLLGQAHADLDSFRSMLAGSSAVSSELQSTLLTAESADFAARDGFGASYASSVRARVRREFGKVGLDTSPVVTLTSHGGVIPVGITSATGYPIRVEVRLFASHLDPSRDFQQVEVGGKSKPLLFHVRAKTTGRFPVQVQIQTPSGRPLRAAQLVVRSTAYNLVALIITIGAAVFLLAWWARRFLPRKTA